MGHKLVDVLETTAADGTIANAENIADKAFNGTAEAPLADKKQNSINAWLAARAIELRSMLDEVEAAITRLGSALVYKGLAKNDRGTAFASISEFMAYANSHTGSYHIGEVYTIKEGGSEPDRGVEVALYKEGARFLCEVIGSSASADLSGYVPTSRTVNGKALTGNITLVASDIGGWPDYYTKPAGGIPGTDLSESVQQQLTAVGEMEKIAGMTALGVVILHLPTSNTLNEASLSPDVLDTSFTATGIIGYKIGMSGKMQMGNIGGDTEVLLSKDMVNQNVYLYMAGTSTVLEASKSDLYVQDIDVTGYVKKLTIQGTVKLIGDSSVITLDTPFFLSGMTNLANKVTARGKLLVKSELVRAYQEVITDATAADNVEAIG